MVSKKRLFSFFLRLASRQNRKDWAGSLAVVAIGGSHRGADTAAVVTPSYSASILNTVVNEILCKPFDIRNPDPSMDFQSTKLNGGIET